jgi:hypothetical protein
VDARGSQTSLRGLRKADMLCPAMDNPFDLTIWPEL